MTKLKSFVIPKKEITTEKGHVQEISLGNHEEKEIQNIINNSFVCDKTAFNGLRVQKVKSFGNKDAEERYLEKKAELKNLVVGRLPAETYAFSFFPPHAIDKIARDGGVKVGNVRKSVLGYNNKGVHLFRYADVCAMDAKLGSNAYCKELYGNSIWTPVHKSSSSPSSSSELSACLVIFKVLIGRCQTIMVNGKENEIDPSPIHDIHIPDQKPVPHEKSLIVKRDKSMIYIYEYDMNTLSLLSYPRSIYPYAVVYYTKPANLSFKASLTNTAYNNAFNVKKGGPIAAPGSGPQGFNKPNSENKNYGHNKVPDKANRDANFSTDFPSPNIILTNPNSSSGLVKTSQLPSNAPPQHFINVPDENNILNKFDALGIVDPNVLTYPRPPISTPSSDVFASYGKMPHIFRYSAPSNGSKLVTENEQEQVQPYPKHALPFPHNFYQTVNGHPDILAKKLQDKYNQPANQVKNESKDLAISPNQFLNPEPSRIIAEAHLSSLNRSTIIEKCNNLLLSLGIDQGVDFFNFVFSIMLKLLSTFAGKFEEADDKIAVDKTITLMIEYMSAFNTDTSSPAILRVELQNIIEDLVKNFKNSCQFSPFGSSNDQSLCAKSEFETTTRSSNIKLEFGDKNGEISGNKNDANVKYEEKPCTSTTSSGPPSKRLDPRIVKRLRESIHKQPEAFPKVDSDDKSQIKNEEQLVLTANHMSAAACIESSQNSGKGNDQLIKEPDSFDQSCKRKQTSESLGENNTSSTFHGRELITQMDLPTTIPLIGKVKYAYLKGKRICYQDPRYHNQSYKTVSASGENCYAKNITTSEDGIYKAPVPRFIDNSSSSNVNFNEELLTDQTVSNYPVSPSDQLSPLYPDLASPSKVTTSTITKSPNQNEPPDELTFKAKLADRRSRCKNFTKNIQAKAISTRSKTTLSKSGSPHTMITHEPRNKRQKSREENRIREKYFNREAVKTPDLIPAHPVGVLNKLMKSSNIVSLLSPEFVISAVQSLNKSKESLEVTARITNHSSHLKPDTQHNSGLYPVTSSSNSTSLPQPTDYNTKSKIEYIVIDDL